MIEMPLNQLPATVDRASIELKFDAAKGKLTIDAAQLGGLVSYNIDRLHELDEVGVVGFKCFVATCGDRGIDNDFQTSMTGSSSKVRRSWANWDSRCWCTAKTR